MKHLEPEPKGGKSITALLPQLCEGNLEVEADLIPQIYPARRQLAARYMRRERWNPHCNRLRWSTRHMSDLSSSHRFRGRIEHTFVQLPRNSCVPFSLSTPAPARLQSEGSAKSSNAGRCDSSSSWPVRRCTRATRGTRTISQV